MNGFSVAEAGHFVNVLPPVSISGGVTGQAFNVGNCEHVSIQIQFGVFGAALPTAILVKGCTTAAGAGATAIPFRYYLATSGGTSVDTTSPPVVATSAGILAAVLGKINATFVLIEIDSVELEQALGDGYKYLQVSITDSGNVTYASISAILSGQRFAYQGGLTETV